MKIANTGYWDGQDAHMYHGYSNALVNWLINFLKEDKNKPLYDFGCGTGQYLQLLQQSGFTKLTGFEGDPPIQKVFSNIIKQDLTSPFKVAEPGNCLFLEVAEHIPSDFENIALDNIVGACCGKLIMSWAIRGQGGSGHVNCLDNHEAIEKFVYRGMVYLEKETAEVRSLIDPAKISIPNRDLPWFHNTTLVFQK